MRIAIVEDEKKFAKFLFAIVCILVLILNWGVRIFASGISRFFYNACLIYDLTCCVILLVVQVQQKREVNLQASVVAERRLREKMKEQYALSKENIDIINRKCHDLKHQISLLRGMADSPEKEEIIRSLEENVNIYDTRLETENEALSVVLREKGLLCQENGIQWTCMVDGSLLDFMKTVDLYTLFGNALDNAIEACSKIEDAQKKVIAANVAVSMLGDVMNSYLGSSTVDAQSMESAAKSARKLSKEAEKDSAVLLENKDNTLPLSSDVTKVNVFGWAATNWLGGGSGSGGVAQVKTDFLKALERHDIAYNEDLIKMYQDFQESREYDRTLGAWPEQTARLYEPSINDANYYSQGLLDEAKAYSDTAFVVIGRWNGESNDATQKQYKLLVGLDILAAVFMVLGIVGVVKDQKLKKEMRK